MVAGLDFFERDNGFNAVVNKAGSGGAQAGERIERSQGAALGLGFKAFTQQEKSENQQDRVEVNLAASRGPEGGIGGVSKGHAGSQAHQGVHVGVSVAQGADGAEVNAAAGPCHDDCRENQKKPAQRFLRKRIKPGHDAHESVIERAHLCSQRHGQQHGGGSGDDGNRSFSSGAICIRLR